MKLKFTAGNKALCAVAIAVIVTMLSYIPILQGEFLNFDDDAYVTENSHIKELSVDNLKRIFSSQYTLVYVPLSVVTYALEYRFFGLNPFIYHFTNLVIHLCNTALVFWLIWLLLQTSKGKGQGGRACPGIAAATPGVRCQKSGVPTLNLTPNHNPNPQHHYSNIPSFQHSSQHSVIQNILLLPFITALLFGINPIQVEAVAWITERKGLVCAFFFLAGLIAYIFYTIALNKTRRRLFYTGALVMFLASLLSKAAGVMFPVVLILIDIVMQHQTSKVKSQMSKVENQELSYKSQILNLKSQINKIPFFILALAFGLVAHFMQHSHVPQFDYYIIGLQDNLFSNILLACRNVVFYIEKIFFPVNLSCLYPQAETLFPCLFSLAFLLCAGGFLFFGLKNKSLFARAILPGIAFFLIMIAPMSQLLSEFGLMRVAERFCYLPCIGIFYSIAAGLFILWQNIRRKSFLIVACLVYAVSLSYLTWKRNEIWQNSFSLWKDTLRKPTQESTARNFLANAYIRDGKIPPAIDEFRRAIQADTKHTQSLINMGYYSALDGRLIDALAWYDRAITSNPNVTKPYFNRGCILLRLNRFHDAIGDFSFVLKFDTNNLDALKLRAQAFERIGKTNAAQEDFKRIPGVD